MIQTVAKHRYFRGKRAKQSVREYTNYVAYRSGRDSRLGGRKFFDKERDEISSSEVQAILRQQDDRGVVAHELILSPGIQTVDAQDYTRELMEKLERSKGLELEWEAVEHKSEHNHIHVLISGSDVNGKRVLLRKNDYKNLRDWGDKYLEKYHSLERYLEKEELIYVRDFDLEYEREKGDKLYELLYPVSQKQAEESDLDLTAIMNSWDREKAVAELADEEKIYAEQESYHKFSTVEELEHLDSYLRATNDRIPKDQYSQLHRWIREKESYGDDHHERLAREKHAKDLIEKMATEDERRELEERLRKLIEEREARYREEDERKEKERHEEDERLEKERVERDEEDQRKRDEEEQRIRQERIEEDARRDEEDRIRQENIEKERLDEEERLREKRVEEDQKLEEERKVQEIKEKLELAKQAEQAKREAEKQKRDEALKSVSDFKKINKDFTKRYQGESPGEKLFNKKGRNQRLHEQRGRSTEWHIRYQNSMARKALEEKLSREPSLKEQIQNDIEKIKEMEARQLEGEKLEKIDLKSLDTNANKYLLDEDKEIAQEQQPEQQKEEDINWDQVWEEEQEWLGDQKAREEEFAKDIRSLETDDGKVLFKTSNRKELEEYKEQLQEVVDKNWEEGRGYQFKDEVKLTTVNSWIDEQDRELFGDDIFTEADIEKLQNEAMLRNYEVREEFDIKVEERCEEYYNHGFQNDDNKLISADEDKSMLLSELDDLDHKEYDYSPTDPVLNDEQREEQLADLSKRLVLSEWLKEKDREEYYQLSLEEREAELSAFEIDEIELEDGRKLSVESEPQDLNDYLERLGNEINKLDRDDDFDDYLRVVKERAAAYNFLVEQNEGLYQHQDRTWLSRMNAKEVEEIELENGEKLTPESSLEDIISKKEEVSERLAVLEGKDDRSDEYYQTVKEQAALENWHMLKDLEHEPDKAKFLNLEFEPDDKPVFEEGITAKEKQERIEQAREHYFESLIEKGSIDFDQEEKEQISGEIKQILRGEYEPERAREEIEKSAHDYEDPTKGADNKGILNKLVSFFKGEDSEKEIERDELDELLGFPETEREHEIELDRTDDEIDRGDQGMTGDRGDSGGLGEAPGQEFTPEPSVEAPDPGVVDNTDGFKGRDDDDMDREDEGYSR